MNEIIAIIEIPKGDSRRRHMAYDKSGFIDLGPIGDVIPFNNGVMPEAYGYILDTVNPSEKDEIDVIVISPNSYLVGERVQVEPIALLTREDGDDKVVAVSTGDSVLSWENLSDSQKDLLLGFFGYKSNIVNIGSKEEAIAYIKSNR